MIDWVGRAHTEGETEQMNLPQRIAMIEAGAGIRSIFGNVCACKLPVRHIVPCFILPMKPTPIKYNINAERTKYFRLVFYYCYNTTC